MTPYELKYQHICKNPDSHFFERSTMRFFGDTMRNYGVATHDAYYELYRKRPVKHGLDSSAYFDKVNFKRIIINRVNK